MRSWLSKAHLISARWISACAIFCALAFASAPLVTPAHGQDTAPPGQVLSDAAESAPLDGLEFSARIVREGNEDSADKPLGDTLTFDHGEFSSAICKRFNFTPAPYWIRSEGETLHFMAELNSPTDGRMIWKGTISDGKLEGTMRWIRKRWYWTIDARHNLQGELMTSTTQTHAN